MLQKVNNIKVDNIYIILCPNQKMNNLHHKKRLDRPVLQLHLISIDIIVIDMSAFYILYN